MLRLSFLLCCLIISTLACSNTSFLALSDIHYGSKNTSEDGRDTGDDFFKVALEKANNLSKQVQFVLVLGDLPTHLFGKAIEKEQYETKVFHALYEIADENKKPMFYISGNNDSLWGNYQPFALNGKSPLDFAIEWHGACAYCEGLIIDESHMYSDGYYSSHVVPGNNDIVLIALNATQWMKTPILLPKYPDQDRDALLQLTWLAHQLESNKAKQLIIAMHEPPGNDFMGNPMWHEPYLAQFIELLRKHQSRYKQITLLTSHSHMDEFRKITLTATHSIYAYSTPSISRNHHNNPGMKIFKLDSQLRMKDFTTYYTSSTTEWGSESYHAITAPHAIFPNCSNLTLAQCLDDLSDNDVCDDIELGLYYGVKSLKVDNSVCRKFYRVG